MLDTVIVFILVLFGIKGFWAGDFRELRGLLAMGFSFLLGFLPHHGLSQDLITAGVEPVLASAMAILISAVLVFPMAHFILSILFSGLKHFGRKQSLPQRWLGAGFSFLKGMVLVILVSNLLLKAPIQSNKLDESRLIQSFRLFDDP